MKSIHKKIIPRKKEANRNNSSHLIFAKKKGTINKTPDLSDSNRCIKDKMNSQSLISSTISFNRSSAHLKNIFKNKEEFNKYILYKRFLFYKTQYNKILSQILETDNKIKENEESIEKMKNFLEKFKNTKKQKQSEIVNLLSNKESLEEIYKSKIYHLKNASQLFNIKKHINLDDNNSSKSSTIYLFENDFEVTIEEIKLSDKQKYEEQIITFTEEILKKKDEKIRNKIKEKINIAYSVLINELNSTSNIDYQKIISNFFTRIALFISNQSLGNYSEQFISPFLRQLIKINFVGVEISKILKFLNKKYKETKSEIRKKISDLNTKNENLKRKILIYEIKKENLKNFIEENKEITKINNKNRKSLEEDNIQYKSFFSDRNNFSKCNIFNTKNIENITNEENGKYKSKGKIHKLKSFNKPQLSRDTIFKKEISKNKNRNKSKDFDNSNINFIKKNLNMKKILKVNKYLINTWNNKYNNGIINNKGLLINPLDNIENININNSQIIDKYNNYIFNCIPINKGINSQTYNNNIEQNENTFCINKNKNGIKINNLLINNNNINIQNNSITNNNRLQKGNSKTKSMNIIYCKSIDNSKINKKVFNDKTRLTKKKINIPNNNNYKKINNRRSINTDKLGNFHKDFFLNCFEKYEANNNITEINYNNKKRNNLKENNENFNINNYNFHDILNFSAQTKNGKNFIMLNNSKCISQKNINKTNINNNNDKISPIPKSRIILQKKNQNSEIALNNNNKLNNSKYAKSSYEDRMENNSRYFSKISTKHKDLENNSMRKRFLDHKIIYSHNTSNSYKSNKDNSLNTNIDISTIEKQDKIYTKRYDNRLKSLINGIKKSFCYFKIVNNDNHKFDPLHNCSSTPENFGYIDGYISIDIKQHKLKIIPKNLEDISKLENLLNNDFCSSNISNFEEENDKSYIGIELKDIADILIGVQMKNIIRIYNIYLKYSKEQENVKINRFIYSREIMDIPMEYDDRIKAAFCNFFIFSVIFRKKLVHKLEFIFINFEHFNLWFDCLKYITKINNQPIPTKINRTFNSANNSKIE